MAAFDSRQENTHAIELPHSIDTPQGACVVFAHARECVCVCGPTKTKNAHGIGVLRADSNIANRCNAIYPVSDDGSNMWMILY